MQLGGTLLFAQLTCRVLPVMSEPCEFVQVKKKTKKHWLCVFFKKILRDD